MTRTIIIIIYLSLTLRLFGQIPKLYTFYVRQADSLWKKKEYKKSAFAYSSAFMTLGNKGSVPDRYNAARVWSLSNIPDSSFDCLSRIINKKYFRDFRMLNYESDFDNIRSDERWKSLLDTLKLYDNTQDKVNKRYPNTTIAIKNTLDTTVSVYYLRTEADEIYFFDLKPMQTKFQQSYLGNSWIIRRKSDSKKVLKFKVKNMNQEFETPTLRRKRRH